MSSQAAGEPLPLGWALTKLNAVGVLFCGQSPAVADVNTNGIGTPYVTGPAQWDGQRLHMHKWTTTPKRMAPDGTIFITVKGAGVGTLFPGCACAIGRDVYAFLPESGVDRDFVVFALRHNIGEVIRKAQGDIPGLTREHILDHEIHLPPVAEQRRIVAKLEALLAKVDTSRKRLERIPVILKRFRQAVLAAACEGRLTEDWRDENPYVAAADSLFRIINETRAKALRMSRTASNLDSALNRMVSELENPFHPDTVIPATWAWARFGDVIGELRNGISTRPEMEPPGTPILRISAVRGGSVDLNETRFLPNGDDHVPSSSLREGDLLFTRYNGSIELLGVCGMVRDLKGQNLLYPDKLMRVRFDHEAILPSYAEIYFQSSKVHDRITEKSKSSAGQNGVSGGDIKAQAFALPPIEEQSEIVRRVAQLFTLADQIEARYLKAKTHLDRLTQSILAKAFRGELVPQDPDDEPAEQLLARLHSEAAVIPAAARRHGRSAAPRASAESSSGRRSPSSPEDQMGTIPKRRGRPRKIPSGG